MLRLFAVLVAVAERMLAVQSVALYGSLLTCTTTPLPETSADAIDRRLRQRHDLSEDVGKLAHARSEFTFEGTKRDRGAWADDPVTPLSSAKKVRKLSQSPTDTSLPGGS